MATTWPYAELTREAAIHGGPQAFLSATRCAGFCEGVAVCILIGATHYIFDRYVYRPLCQKQVKADMILADDNAKFKRIINDEEDIEHVRSILKENDVEEMSTEETLENLKARLEALKGDAADCRHYLDLEKEEEDIKKLHFEDKLFSFLAEVKLYDEDEVFVRMAKSHPLYRSYARIYREEDPEADELQIVKDFAITMAPLHKKEEHDGV